MQVDLLSRMDSPYLVGLLGYCADQSHRLLVYTAEPGSESAAKLQLLSVLAPAGR